MEFSNCSCFFFHFSMEAVVAVEVEEMTLKHQATLPALRQLSAMDRASEDQQQQLEMTTTCGTRCIKYFGAVEMLSSKVLPAASIAFTE